MFEKVGLFFSDRSLAEQSQLVRIAVGEDQEADDIVDKVSEPELDFEFKNLALELLLDDGKKVGIYVGTDAEQLARNCASNNHDLGYAIILPGAAENYFYLQPELKHGDIAYTLFDLSNGKIRIRQGQESKEIPPKGYQLKPEDVIMIGDKRIQFKYIAPRNNPLESTQMLRREDFE